MMLQQRVQIEGEGTTAWPVRHVSRESEAPMVEGHDPEVAGQVRDLLPPDEMVPSGSVGQHEGGAFAKVFVA